MFVKINYFTIFSIFDYSSFHLKIVLVRVSIKTKTSSLIMKEKKDFVIE